MLFSLDGYAKLESDDNESRESSFDNGNSNREHRYGKTRVHRTSLALVFLTLLDIFFLSMWIKSEYSPKQKGMSCVRPQLTFSSARDSGAIEYERRRLFRRLENNPFTGSPRPEHDQAWREIVDPLTTFIKVSEYNNADLGGSTLKLRDGSGYVGELAVYHELHCIKRIRHWLHRDHYYPNITAADSYLEDVHIDHCLEYWREAAMCRADSSVATFFWRDGVPTSRAYSDHECVNWNKFDSWARSRMMDMRDLDVLDQTDRWKYIRTPDAKTALREHPEIEVHP